MTGAGRIWVGAALAAVGVLLFAFSMWLMPLWMICLMTGAGALGGSYRILTHQQREPAQAPTQAAAAAAAPAVEPTAVPVPISSVMPGAPKAPLTINVASFQDGRPMGRKQVPIHVSVPRSDSRRQS